jgi:hypothetical protein
MVRPCRAEHVKAREVRSFVCVIYGGGRKQAMLDMRRHKIGLETRRILLTYLFHDILEDIKGKI